MKRIGNYRLIATIGRGGMADVYLGLASGMQGFQKLMVLKTLKPELAADPEFIEMFLAEARVAALLNHPNIVQTYEVGTSEGGPFIAMEYLEGQPLSAILARVGRAAFPLDLFVHVLVKLLTALQVAHDAADLNGRPLEIVHRDVSPQNVFVTYDGQIKLLDFGIAKLASSSALTKHGVLKGKVGYMAPEQALGSPVDRRADIYAVGVMLWEALMQKRLVAPTDDDSVAIQRRLAGAEPPVTSTTEPMLAAICARAMAPDRAERFATAVELREALAAWLGRSAAVLEQDLSRLVQAAFEQERSQLRKQVEAQVTESERESGNVSLVDLGAPAGDAAARRRMHADPSHEAVATVAPPSQTERRKAAQRSRLKPALLGGALVVVLAGALLWRGSSSSPGAPSLVSAEPSAPTATSSGDASTGAVEAASSAVRLRVNVRPAGATLLLDDVPAEAPLDRRLARGTHRLRVSAAGYESDDRTLALDADLVVDIALHPLPAAPAPPASDAAALAPAKATRPAPATSSRVRRSPDGKPTPLGIDEKDPYK